MSLTPDNKLADPEQFISDLQRQIAVCNAERDEERAQKAALSQLFELISSPSGDLGLVFDTLLATGARLCKAEQAVISLSNPQDGLYHYRASFGYSREFKDLLIRNPVAPGRASLIGRTALEGRVVHLEDAVADPEYKWAEALRLGRWHTGLGVPLLRDDAVIGTLALTRRRIERFTDKQIELIKTFADQAVIAIENARLLGELRESEERYSLVSKAVAEGIYEWDVEHNSLWVSSRLIEIFGFQGRNLTAADWNNLIHPEDFSQYRTALRDCFKGITARLDCEYRVRHGDGQYRWIEDRGVPVRNASGRAVRLVGAVSDITARKAADEALREALEQQTATAEVLQVINSSPGDVAPVFDAILEKALSLCEAAHGHLTVHQNGHFHCAAAQGDSRFVEWFRRRPPYAPGPGTTMEKIVQGASVVQVADVTDDEAYRLGDLVQRALVEIGGSRTGVSVALRKEDTLFGAVTVYRQEVRPFSDKQIALLQNFAAQAVIAMENARLLTETRQALEHQTATAEVLQVINSSPGDLAPVFNTILEKAHKLCEAPCGSLQIFDGELFRAVAVRGFAEPFAEMLRQGFRPPPAILNQRVVVQADMAELLAGAPSEPILQASVEIAKIRTVMFVPLRREETLLGRIVAARQEVRPFTDKQIALLQNFAAQAVIAMENARLLTETREALEQQTATAEVLQVINSSPGDLAPVFDAMLDKATRLCEAEIGVLWTYHGDGMEASAVLGAPPRYDAFLRQGPRPLSPAHQRLRQGERVIQIANVPEYEGYLAGLPLARALFDLGGVRTILLVSLRKDEAALGAFAVYRQDVRPFTDKQIALLENFAAQAVIAMENARLLTETREALDQQTATAEVLEVINSSPGDLTPVFDAMLERAMRLCEAAFGFMMTYDGDRFRPGAQRGVARALAEYLAAGPDRPGPGEAHTRVLAGEELIHSLDFREEEPYRRGAPLRCAVVDLGGARTALVVALRKENLLLGTFTLYRQEVRPFTDKQIALVQNFAAQAVIAMENARLLGELRERTHDLEESLEYQTATSDVLQVISRSTFDLQPVLDALEETAVRLCNAEMGLIVRRDGEVYRVAATFAFNPAWEVLVRPQLVVPERGTIVGRSLLERRAVQVADVAADPEYAHPDVVTIGQMRTVLGVPLLREGEPIGAMSVCRTRVEPFSDRQIELVRTFADQAVIAIENARLLSELRESLEQQQAIAEVLQVINSSPGNLAPVYAAILEKAHNLCGITVGTLQLYDGAKVRTVAQRGVTGRFAELLEDPYTPVAGHPASRLLGGERLVHIIDHGMDESAKQQPDNPRAQASAQQGLRTTLWVPLRKDAELLGYISAFRQEVRPFSDKEIALLESFAAQAVIAMDNARLLNEIRQRQAELRVTFDNMGDGVAMFDAELRLAAWNLNFQRILELPDPLLAERPHVEEVVRYLATHGEYGAVDIEAEVRRLSERVGTQWSAERTRPDGRVIEVRSNPVPGGGSVLIYSDVTDRKRAEAEIRAARDAAEKALGELQTAQASLVHAQKMAALGQLTAGIAHEIKNPLNFVNNFAELSGELLQELRETTAPVAAALDDDTRAEVDEIVEMLRGNLAKIAEHGKRADGIVKSMLEHSRGVSGERRVVDLNGVIDEALNLAYHGARAQDASFNVTFEREFDQGLAPIELVPQDITRVCLNLIGNGFYATTKRQREGGDGSFKPTLKVSTRDLGDAVEVRIRDNGIGIAPELRDKLFQPFFTTKPTGEGTGLGLSISYDIVTQQHGGTIAVDSTPGEFTEFTIRLPRTRLISAEAAS
jgi:PAS domain S-box-containing protein